MNALLGSIPRLPLSYQITESGNKLVGTDGGGAGPLGRGGAIGRIGARGGVRSAGNDLPFGGVASSAVGIRLATLIVPRSSTVAGEPGKYNNKEPSCYSCLSECAPCLNVGSEGGFAIAVLLPIVPTHVVSERLVYEEMSLPMALAARVLKEVVAVDTRVAILFRAPRVICVVLFPAMLWIGLLMVFPVRLTTPSTGSMCLCCLGIDILVIIPVPRRRLTIVCCTPAIVLWLFLSRFVGKTVSRSFAAVALHRARNAGGT